VTLAVRDARAPDSPVARWDARWKLAAALLFAAAVAVLRQPLPLLAAFAASLGVVTLSRLSLRRTVERIGLLLFAVLPFVLVLPFTVDGGLAVAALVALRCVTIGLIAFVVASTAPLPRTFAAARAMGLPGVLVLVAQLAYRYAFALFAEARRLRLAMRTRAFKLRTNAHTYRTLGHAAGALLVRGGDHADTVAAAMKCRGFDGTPRMLSPFHTTAADVAAFLAVAGGTIALVAWERLS
jgi:cobalt/nickel transport system permease protein